MTLPIPLTVRLQNNAVDRHITRDLRDLSFRSVVPGGFASATFSLDRPLTLTPYELAHFTDVYIHDTRNGNTVWNGWLEDLGKSSTSDGLTWEVSAIGPSAHATDLKMPYILADVDSAGWEPRPPPGPNNNLHRGGQLSAGSNDNGTAMQLVIQVPQGVTVDSSSQTWYFPMRYRRLIDAGMKLARLGAFVDTAFTNATQWKARIFTRTGFDGTATLADTHDVDGSGFGMNANIVDGDFSNGHNVVEISLSRISGSTTIGDSNTYITATNGNVSPGLMILALRVDKSGSEITTGSTSYDDLTHSNIVEDLLGRFLPLYDGANATIGSSSISNSFRQFAYPDPTTASQVLDDVMAVHSDMFWAAWERQSNGYYRFEWSSYGTTPRYVISARDGYQAPDSIKDVVNEVRVRLRSPSGAYLTAARTKAVAVLDDAGRSRTLLLDLGDNLNDSSIANQVGDSALDGHDTANGAQLTVAHPVLNRETGIMEEPWEIRAGCLIQILETGNQHRVISTEYSVSSAAVTLELDVPSMSLSNQVIGRGGRALPSQFGFRRR